MCKNQDDDYNKYDDNRPFEEEIQKEVLKPFEKSKKKFLNFMRNKPWKFILYSFIYALIIFVVSILTKNKGGFLIVFNYPAALVSYLIYFHEEKSGGRRNPFANTVIFLVLPLVAFIVFLLASELF